MPINNKGRLNLSEVVRRQVDKDWPAANTDFDLFVQDLIASGNLIANGLIIRNIDVSDNILTGNVSAGAITANTLVLDVITANVFNGLPPANLSLLTTDDLNEGSVNLYFTNVRAIQSFTAGRGITIADSGVISSIVQSVDHNLTDENSVGVFVSDTLSNVLVFPETPNNDDRYILKSVQITNISESGAYFSGNILFGNADVQFANHIPLPVGSTAEILTTPQVFFAGDSVQLIGYNSSLTPESNIISAILAYEIRPGNPGLFRESRFTTEGNVEIELVDFNEKSGIIQSIKLNNLGTESTKAKITWKNSNDHIISYFTYNLPLPINSSVEVITYPKRLNNGDKLTLTLSSYTEVSAIISGRYADQTTIQLVSNVIPSGTNTLITYSTELLDGTIVYYSLE